MVRGNKLLTHILFSKLLVWDVKRLSSNRHYNSKFKLVPFSDVLYDDNIEWVDIKDDDLYPILGVHAYGEGVYINRIAQGNALTMKRYQKSKANTLFWCKVRTVRGQFGIVTDEYANSYGSSNMKYMSINTELIMPEYLQLLFQKNPLTDYMDTLAVGADGRHFSPSVFMGVKFPLPPIDVQIELIKKYSDSVQKAKEIEHEADLLVDEIENYLFYTLKIEKPMVSKDDSKLLKSTSFSKLIGWGARANSNPIKPREIFNSTQFENLPLESFCMINPKTIYPDDIEDVSFIPMECVSDIYGEIIEHKNGKPTNSKGYTSFQENDVIWAKITPCMQNGKCAVATGLKNGYAYGSTEFHVFRANKNALPEYIHCFLRSKRLREVAMSYFTGSAGQQRVGTDFLKALTLPKLPLRSDDPNVTTQETIVKKVIEIRTQIKELHIKAANIRKQAKKEFEEAIFGE